MDKEFIIFISIIYVILFFIDLYVFKGIALLFKKRPSLFSYLYWAYSITVYVGLAYVFLGGDPIQAIKENGYGFFNTVTGLMFLSVIPKLVFVAFHFLEDISFIPFLVKNSLQSSAPKISRYTFITRLGLYIAAIPFISVLYGILKGRFAQKVEHVTLKLSTLPKAFDKLKIVQISDAHLGSFCNQYDKLKPAFDKINALKPDLVFFTGDLVNHFAFEAQGWQPYFKSIKATIGKFAVLGNHDYSDYMSWDSIEEKQQNLEQLKQFYIDTDFRLLLNEHVEIIRDDQRIHVLGVENWGKGGFAKYGRLDLALKDSPKDYFQLLLSHDPSHWDEKVLKDSNIDLTFSGHTHGMQFGINLGKLKYSPVQHRYPRWMGLYKQAGQYLYVNRGLGFLGFPGRVGMSPEVTLIELECA